MAAVTDFPPIGCLDGQQEDLYRREEDATTKVINSSCLYSTLYNLCVFYGPLSVVG